MPIRRKSDPTNIQCIWDAIKYLLWQRLAPEPNKVVTQLIKLNGFSVVEWKKCINEALEDNLITVGFRRDQLREIYKMPEIDMLLLDGRDWYCFECHLAGDVLFCKNKLCPRVYHPECVTKTAINSYKLFKNLFNNSDSTVFLKKSLTNRKKSLCLEFDGIEMVGGDDMTFKTTFDNTLCTVCNMVTLDNFELDKLELNHLFEFVLDRIRSWIPEDITQKLEGPQASPPWQTHKDLTYRASHLFFENKSMSVIDANIKSNSYSKCHSFLSDVLTINHNIGIFHGVESQEYQATKFVLRDTLHDLGEIIGCVDCYKHSNEKINKNWFSLPCRTEHEIVWAKQKGYSYWPAKVVKKGSLHYDVRFFGDKHERALLSKQFVQPISIPKESLKVKKSATFLKALKELELHQELSQSPSALEAFIALSEKGNSLPNKRKSSAGRPKKLNSATSLIANGFEDKALTKKKRGRKKKDKNESSYQPVRKKGRISLPAEGVTTTGSADIPVEKRERITMPIKKGSESTGIITDVEDTAQKKKKQKSLKKGSKKQKKESVRNTRSSLVDQKLHKEMSDDDVNGSDVINISDGEDVYTFSGNLTMSAMKYGDSYEQLQQVTSSTEVKTNENMSQEMQQLDHPFSDEVEMMRRTLEGLTDKKEIIKHATTCMQREIDRVTEKHNEHVKKLFESHNFQISETKKKQWCFYCGQDAIYHCCWNTAYCSTTCQQQHWLVEHKKVCRRKK